MVPSFNLAAIVVHGPARCTGITCRPAFLTVYAAGMSFNEGKHPYLFAGIWVAGVELADNAELVTRTAVNQHDAVGLGVLDDRGSASHRVADLVIAKFLAPDNLSGVLVQRVDAGIERAKKDLVAIDCRAAVHDVTAGADIVGQAGLEFPQTLASLSIQRPHPAIAAGDVDHAVMD